MDKELHVRWTIGDVSKRGFAALRFSIWGAWKMFGPEADYTVCVNSIPLEKARSLTGDLPGRITWYDSTNKIPEFIKSYMGENMAEGVGWKFAPLSIYPDKYSLSLDNDCIMWEAPDAIKKWLDSDEPNCVIAEDVRPCFGQFTELCGIEPRNSGIRGLPPGFDLEMSLRRVLEKNPVKLTSELDEQGLQVAALSLEKSPFVVRVNEVSICSPFPPHMPDFGTHGVHFVGLNAKQLPWSLNGRQAVEYIKEHWEKKYGLVYEKIFS